MKNYNHYNKIKGDLLDEVQINKISLSDNFKDFKNELESIFNMYLSDDLHDEGIDLSNKEIDFIIKDLFNDFLDVRKEKKKENNMQLSDIPNKDDFKIFLDSIDECKEYAMIYEFIFDYQYDSYNDAFANIFDELGASPEDYDFSFKHLSLFIIRFY